jgi:DNA-binding transcriptional MerR regulator
MYSIGEISVVTGITACTLRYYEKIGVLPEGGEKPELFAVVQPDRWIRQISRTG